VQSARSSRIDGQRSDALRSAGILLLPLLIGLPIAWSFASHALGQPFPCGIDDVPGACPPEQVEAQLNALLLLLAVVPLVLYLASIATAAVLAVRRRRSWPATAIGVALMAVSGAAGIIFWLSVH
jgi:hypothetical protein